VTRATLLLTVVAGVAGAGHASTAPVIDTTGTRLDGVETGSHAVGFEVRSDTDRTRRINPRDEGTRIGLAIWYPARPADSGGATVTALDYRLLDLGPDPTPAETSRFAEDEASALVGWRHIGVVELTKEQALGSLATRGIARRGAPPAAGRFPVVMLLGGPFYLSTTAEALASHGFLVAAPFRFKDQSNEVQARHFAWYFENSVRDAEWALDRLREHAAADLGFVGALGHGGGGMQALLLAMRDRAVSAVANVDAANFSSRSTSNEMPSYDPRLLRVPYLFIATEETRKSLDRFDDFLQMRFSDRYEVALRNPDLRHHDLSDIGRAVTAPMALRGAAQQSVQRDYATTQRMLVRFFRDLSTGGSGSQADFSRWLQAGRGEEYSITFRKGLEPAPTLEATLDRLGASTLPTLRQALGRDPEAAIFEPESLSRLLVGALVRRDFETADGLARFALELHPGSAVLAEHRSEALEGRGEVASALAVAKACAAADPGSDWRSAVAIDACKERVERLQGRHSTVFDATPPPPAVGSPPQPPDGAAGVGSTVQVSASARNARLEMALETELRRTPFADIVTRHVGRPA